MPPGTNGDGAGDGGLECQTGVNQSELFQVVWPEISQMPSLPVMFICGQAVREIRHGAPCEFTEQVAKRLIARNAKHALIAESSGPGQPANPVDRANLFFRPSDPAGRVSYRHHCCGHTWQILQQGQIRPTREKRVMLVIGLRMHRQNSESDPHK